MSINDFLAVFLVLPWILPPQPEDGIVSCLGLEIRSLSSYYRIYGNIENDLTG